MQIFKPILAALTLLATTCVNADWVTRSDTNAKAVISEIAGYRPETAAAYGMSEYDAQVMDLDAGYVERAAAADQRALKLLADRIADEEDVRVLEDLKILQQATRDGIESRRITHQHLLPFMQMHMIMFYSFRSILDPRTDTQRYPNALIRLRKYAGVEPGYRPITQLARARTEERFEVAGLTGPYIGEIENYLDAAPRLLVGMRQIFEASGLNGWRDDFAILETHLNEYAVWVEQHLRPRARHASALPPPVYANNLKEYGVTASPDQLIREGQAAYQFIRSEMKALARQIAAHRDWEQQDLLAIMDRFKQQRIEDAELLDLYKERLGTLESIIRRERIISLPARDASIRLATEAESAAIPASFMSPPQLINNTGQYGEFVLVQTNPALGKEARMDDWSHPAITWALTVHEARPGHELQFASLVENGTSLARSIFASNSANVEGWGLYAEAIMHEHLPPEGQLFSLFTRLIRAARMFLDPMVNTGRIHRDDAERFLVEQAGLSRAMASSEADRYAFRSPGQATAYYFGYQNLMRLRTEVELAQGRSFDQMAFHDFVIEQGLLPPELLREAVLRWVSQTQEAE